MILCRITMNVLPEKQKEVLQTLSSMLETSDREDGVLSYGIFRDIKDSRVFNLISEWTSRPDLDRHIRSDRFGVILGIKSLLEEPMAIRLHTVTLSEGMETVTALRKKKTDYPIPPGKGS